MNDIFFIIRTLAIAFRYGLDGNNRCAKFEDNVLKDLRNVITISDPNNIYDTNIIELKDIRLYKDGIINIILNVPREDQVRYHCMNIHLKDNCKVTMKKTYDQNLHIIRHSIQSFLKNVIVTTNDIKEMNDMINEFKNTELSMSKFIFSIKECSYLSYQDLDITFTFNIKKRKENSMIISDFDQIVINNSYKDCIPHNDFKKRRFDFIDENGNKVSIFERPYMNISALKYPTFSESYHKYMKTQNNVDRIIDIFERYINKDTLNFDFRC